MRRPHINHEDSGVPPTADKLIEPSTAEIPAAIDEDDVGQDSRRRLFPRWGRKEVGPILFIPRSRTLWANRGIDQLIQNAAKIFLVPKLPPAGRKLCYTPVRDPPWAPTPITQTVSRWRKRRRVSKF